MSVDVCWRPNCTPKEEGDRVRCEECGLSAFPEVWPTYVKAMNDAEFDGVAKAQWEHDTRPFFVGSVKTGFWVMRGKKYKEYPK